MISSEVDRHNYQLLSQLEVGQNISADRTGKLHIIDNKSFITNFVQKIFQNQKQIQHIVQSFVIEKLKEKKFHDVTWGRDAYLALLNQFAVHQLSGEQRASLAFDYYSQRFRDLMHSGELPWQAECQIVLEMLEDPHIPLSFKQDVAPESFESGVFLKDRAGRKIAIQEEHATPRKL